ncbi:MAG: hypothetical protein K2G69_06205, partial [Muribaculaceae bacterium]|nr:hypothetical protein [Muribaculaceae bacterium]
LRLLRRMKLIIYEKYIRDFFEVNKGKSLKDAIACWKYKKSRPGKHFYEETDLVAIKDSVEKKTDTTNFRNDDF